jgi:prepilin signal peptidase PulO-like enzyme (type II secretory pathway)
MMVPMWIVVAAAVIFACSAYLATSVASMIYAKDAPLEDGPRPGRVGLWQTLVMVVVAAAIGVVSVEHASDLRSLAVTDLAVFALCAVIWTDVTRGFIGDWFTLPTIAIVFVVGFSEQAFFPMLISFGLVTLPFVGAALISKGMGMGWGDVKLVALGAALLNVQTSMLMFAIACMVACGIAFARHKRGEPIAFAPYLATAIAIGMIVPNGQNLG